MTFGLRHDGGRPFGWALAAAGVVIALVVAGFLRQSVFALTLASLGVSTLALAGLWWMRHRALDEDGLKRRELTLARSLVEALARAIEARHDASRSQLGRQELYAGRLADALRMSADEVAAVRTAALLLDIGTLAVPDHILSKPGPLTAEEFHKIRLHPQVGAEIVADVPFPYPVASLIRAHHERWDGRGYPAGLRGEAIPLGARVLAVVDSYNALISDRPYRKPLEPDEALEVLAHEAGHALDPAVTERFIQLLPAIEAERAVQIPPPAHVTPPDASTFHHIESARRESHALFEISQAISATLGVDGIARLLASKLETLLDFSACALYVRQPKRPDLVCLFASGQATDLLRSTSFTPGKGALGEAAIEGRSAVGIDLLHETSAEHGVPVPFSSVLMCPLLHDASLVGAIALYHAAPGAFSQDHTRLMEMVGRQAGPVLAHALQLEAAQKDALTDPLTGLPNRRYLTMHVAQELARSRRRNREMALLLVDIDRFKEINDSEGHQRGDEALSKLASVLRSAVRHYDVCARYGGDEFIVLLPDCGWGEAEVRRRELRARINDVQIARVDGQSFRLSVSVGAAVYPEDGQTFESLLAAADARMYRDKHRWRHELVGGGHTRATGDRQSAFPGTALAKPTDS
jgi:diguanylate cyclase (GGDEF)-like protein